MYVISSSQGHAIYSVVCIEGNIQSHGLSISLHRDHEKVYMERYKRLCLVPENLEGEKFEKTMFCRVKFDTIFKKIGVT